MEQWMLDEIPDSLRALARDLRAGKPVEAPTPMFLAECAEGVEQLRSINADLYEALDLLVKDAESNADFYNCVRDVFLEKGRAALDKAIGEDNGLRKTQTKTET